MKRALLAFAFTAFGATVLAAENAKPPAAVQAPLGRLFYTPAERAQLDIARMQRKPAAQAAAAEPVEAPPAPQVVTYGGIVRRSDGKAMLWINNRLVEEKDALSGLSLKGKVRADGGVTFQVPQTGGTIDMKVGQSVELQTGRVGEARKPAPEPKPSAAEDPKPPAADGAPPQAATAAPAQAGTPPGPAAKAPPPDSADKKPAPGAGVGLKLDLGNRTLDPAESQRLSGSK